MHAIWQAIQPSLEMASIRSKNSFAIERYTLNLLAVHFFFIRDEVLASGLPAGRSAFHWKDHLLSQERKLPIRGDATKPSHWLLVPVVAFSAVWPGREVDNNIKTQVGTQGVGSIWRLCAHQLTRVV